MRTRRRLTLALFTLSLVAAGARAGDGGLDPSFGNAGKAFTDVGGDEDGPIVLLQPDGKIVSVGSTAATVGGLYDVALARYRADGTPDPAFGNGGKTKLDLFQLSELAFNGALQADGKIVVSGVVVVGDFASFNLQDAYVARFNANGTLDSGFGQNGKARFDLGAFEQFQGLVVQPDQKIIAAGGVADISGTASIALVRLKTDGTPDGTFGPGGKVLTVVPGGLTAQVFNATRQPDGKILVLGGVADGAGAEGDPFIARFLSTGQPDPGFGQGGFKVLAVPGPAQATDAALQPDGRIVVSGIVPHQASGAGSHDFAVWRLLQNGALDSSFDGDGRAQTDFSGLFDFALAIVVQADGRIVAAGGADSPNDPGDELPNGHTALARYLANGSPDPSFGSGGRQVFAQSTSIDQAFGLVIQGDGKLIVTGGAKRSNVDFFVSRHLNSAGGDTSPCVATDSSLCLGGRFEVKATYSTASQAGQAHAAGITTDTGYFWFFNSQNVEAVIKTVDGCGLGGKYWVFGAGLTDVNTVITVRDSHTGAVKTYTNPSGTPFKPIQDTGAFAGCGASTAGVSAPYPRPAPASTDLRLGNNRFKLTATWKSTDGATGTGQGVALTTDTGFFWFFNAANVEVVAKVIDGCGLNQRYWLFAGGLTNVKVDLTLTDTVTGKSKTYSNPLGTKFAPIQNTAALSACP
jgi:uncharacterized delta-60 repeat protein